MQYIVAYDFGTTSVKTCLFSIDGGIRMEASAYAPYGLYILPGGGAEFGPQPVEVIFYVLDGVISIETDNGDITLEPGQAVHIHKGENKGVHNRTNAPASMLVIAKVPDEMAH